MYDATSLTETAVSSLKEHFRSIGISCRIPILCNEHRVRQNSILISRMSPMISQKNEGVIEILGTSKSEMAVHDEGSAGACEHLVITEEHVNYSNLQEGGRDRFNHDAFFQPGKINRIHSRQPSSLGQYVWTPRASFETDEGDLDKHRFTAEAPNKPLPPLPPDAKKQEYKSYREASNISGHESQSVESYGNTRQLLLSRLPSSRDSAQSFAQLSIINADGSIHSQNLSEAESRELKENIRAKYAKLSIEANNKTHDVLDEILRSKDGQALDLGPGSSQGSSSIRSSSLPSQRSIQAGRSSSRPQTRRGFLFGRHAVDLMGVNSSSSDPHNLDKRSGHGRIARMIAASKLRRHASPTGRHGSSMRSFSSATRASARDGDDWETVNDGSPVGRLKTRKLSIKVAGGSSIADISDYGSLSQPRQSESWSPHQRLPHSNHSENWSIMAEEHTGRTVLVSGSRMGITNIVPITPNSKTHPRYQHPMPLPDDHVHPFNAFPPNISPYESPSLPKSSSFVPSNYEDYSRIISDDGNFTEKSATMGSSSNITGTPNGTGARLVGSSLADFSSPGFDTSPLDRWPSSPPEENIYHNARVSSQEWTDTLNSSESSTVRRNRNHCAISLYSQIHQSGSQKSLPPLPDELVNPGGTVLDIKMNKSSSGSSSGFSLTFPGEDLAIRYPHLLAIDVESPNLNVFRPLPSSPSEERHQRIKQMRSNNNNLKEPGTKDNGPEAAAADSPVNSRIDPADTGNHDTVVATDSEKTPHISPACTPKLDDAAQRGNANIRFHSSRCHLPYGTVEIFGDHAANVLADIRTPVARPAPSNRASRQQAHSPIVVEGSPHLHARPRLSSTDFQSRQIYLSRVWLMVFIIPFPMLIIMGHGMLDGLIEWQTHGEIKHFRKQEKIAALGLGYGLSLVLVIVVVAWWIARH